MLGGVYMMPEQCRGILKLLQTCSGMTRSGMNSYGFSFRIDTFVPEWNSIRHHVNTALFNWVYKHLICQGQKVKLNKLEYLYHKWNAASVVSTETVLQTDKFYTLVKIIYQPTFRTVVLRRSRIHSEEGLRSETSVHKLFSPRCKPYPFVKLFL